MERDPTRKQRKLIIDFGVFAMLKKIEAIIREDKVNDVKDALMEIGIVGLNIFESGDMAARAALDL
jgi:hypothetical protein